jgi:hypothetical protein
VNDTRPTIWPAVLIALGIFILCGALTGVAWWAAGPTLGLFMAPPALLAIVMPQIVSVISRAWQRWAVWLLASIATPLVWFIALPDMPGNNARQVSGCAIVLSAFVLLLIGLTDGLIRSGIRPTASAAVVTIFSLLWLTWPIWLSGHFKGYAEETLTSQLVWAHPLFAMNAVLFDQWDRYQIMYSTLSSLNQDVPYNIPGSIWPAVLMHAVPGAILLLIPLHRSARAIFAVRLATHPHVR